MLIKQVFSVPGDYERTLKRRRLFAIGFILVGLVGLACSALLLPGSDLPDFAQGFYTGASTGIELGAVSLLIRTQYLLGHPEKRKESQVKEEDEREKAIENRAFLAAGLITFFLSAAALFVVLLLNKGAFCALLGTMMVYAVSFLLANTYFSKKM